MHYRLIRGESVSHPPLVVGDRVKFEQPDTRVWWNVRAANDDFAVLTVQAPFRRRGVLQYTVIDWRSGVRGPCNLIGQGYGDGSYSDTECTEMLAAFDSDDLEVSQRNNVRIGMRLVEHEGDLFDPEDFDALALT